MTERSMRRASISSIPMSGFGSVLPDDSDDRQAIQDLAYTEIIVTCKVEGCLTLFEPSLKEPVTLPVEAWADNMAERAMEMGWTADAGGRVLCPAHRHLAGEPTSHVD